MSILTRIIDSFRQPPRPMNWGYDQRSSVASTYPTYAIGKPVWPERNVYAYQQDALRKVALVFRCVGITSNSIAAAPIRVYDEDVKGNQTTLPDHPMRLLMRRPNPGMRETRFMAFVAMVMAVSGFCVVEKVRSASGRVVELYPLRSDWLKAIPREQAAPDWEYRIPGYTTPYTLLSNDVIVFPYADRPDGSPTGMGPLESALREYGLLNTMTEFVKAFFDGGAMPVYALVPRQTDNGLGSPKRMTQAEADFVKAKWVSRYGGLNRAVEPAILDGIEDVKKLSFDFDELAYTDLRDISEAAICQAFGVSPMLVDAMVGMKHSTYSNKSEARQGFYEDTIVPLWARMDDILTLGLLSEFETRQSVSLEYDTSKIPALQEDRNQKAAWVVQFTLGGGMTVHTAHRELNIPLPPGKDFYLRSIAQSAEPVGNDASAGGDNGARGIEWIGHDDRHIRALAGEENPQIRWRNTRTLEVFEGMSPPKALTTSSNGVHPTDTPELPALPATTRQTMFRLPPEQRASIGATNRTMIDRLARKSEPTIRAFFKGQGERVKANVKKTRQQVWQDATDWVKAAKDLDSSQGRAFEIDEVWTVINHRDLEAIDWQDEEDRLVKLIRGHHVVAGETAFATTAKQLAVEIDWTLGNKHIKKVLDDLAKRIVGMADETRKDVQRIVGEVLDAGGSMDDLAKQIDALFTESYRSRAMTISRTESMVAYGKATRLAYEESGVVSHAEILDNSEHTDDYGAADGLTCAQRDGLIVALDKADFHIEADHPNGSATLIPVLGKPLGEE